jgi:hypothetical protein
MYLHLMQLLSKWLRKIYFIHNVVYVDDRHHFIRFLFYNMVDRGVVLKIKSASAVWHAVPG